MQSSQCKIRDTVSIITEDPALGFYDIFAAQCISEVARKLGCLPQQVPCPVIDGDVVHSWHTGIHPAAFYPMPAAVDINRWGTIAFANPRYTHFHTCGDYAPGEIAWALFDTTIDLDGREYWKDGRFVYLDRPEISGLLPQFGYDETVFRQRNDIGI